MAMSDLGFKIIVKPNNSLTPEASLKVLAGLAAIILVVGLGFSRIGAWWVLPFAGLEILAFAYAFHYIQIHSGDFESITIENDQIVIEKRNYKEVTKTVFQAHWAQINVRGVAGGKGVIGKSGLFIRSHGKEVEFGRNFINDEQRAELARKLKQKLKNIY
ncbi:DUF2244 domain-containing protein [Methylotenera sp.]|uniref:DUF2244 domain-containing protein n=1 Tax=Methylotenera sp. TaxID=2051956 RepID=UPI00271A62FE|nr:DUF2244 domain-containing protein [Methylotenera sp.]MDO9234274.1 DUF2244 domain-containing protein [Methylotenera sp.]MDP2230520.1 DUF2244 domain-containing protein [Methylotenera sp.]MDP3140311.1 DUF2244 domain-containing protein [Methylotenera sp.]MDP3308007.1 DUF2244 domain-containing protein [Methylotenera sp.]MDP3819293.1 DUF2244 domain-containing protein [Methylotenera sp.]